MLTVQTPKRWFPTWKPWSAEEDQVGQNLTWRFRWCSKTRQFPDEVFFLTFHSCFLRLWPEPDWECGVRPASSPPEHEDHDEAGSLATAQLGEQTEARESGGRTQRPLLWLCGCKPILLTCDWAKLQTARSCRGWCEREEQMSPFFPHLCSFTVFSGDLSIPRPRWCNYPHWAERGAAGRLFWALPSMQGVKMPPCRSLCRCVMTEASSAFYIFPCITQNCLVIWHFHNLIVYFPQN